MSSKIRRRIRKGFDYASYLEEHLTVKRAGDELRVCCFVCGDDDYKLYVNNEKKYFNCFKCGFSNRTADVFDFVANLEGVTRTTAQTRLFADFRDVAEDFDFSFLEEDPEPPPPPEIKILESMPAGTEKLTSPENQAEKPYWDWLFNRGLTVREILGMGIHYTPLKKLPVYFDGRYRGDLSDRVLIPVYGGDHQLVSYLGRTIKDITPKYFNAPKSDLSKTLYPYIPADPHSHVVLVEGALDAVAVRRTGLEAFGTFGKHMSKEQVSLLQSWGVDQITLFWDPRDAKPEMKRTVARLASCFRSVYVPRFGGWDASKDAGDALSDPDLLTKMKTMLTTNLIRYDTVDYAIWSNL